MWQGYDFDETFTLKSKKFYIYEQIRAIVSIKQ